MARRLESKKLGDDDVDDDDDAVDVASSLPFSTALFALLPPHLELETPGADSRDADASINTR